MNIIYHPEKLSIKEKYQIIGGVLNLCQYSKLHKYYYISEWQKRILPAINLNQFCYYENENGVPIAFCNWALISAEIRERLIKNQTSELIISDWNSGECLFFPEMIAPFGHARQIIKDLRNRVFSDKKSQKVCAIRSKPFIENGCLRCKRYVQWFTI